MEFHCRLGTPSGQVIEETVVAESEARLRHDLAERGLLILSLRPRGLAALGELRRPRWRRVSGREFLVFNQELATLLKAGMPLVQSLDILRRRAENPTLRGVLDNVHEQVKGGTALSEAFASHRDLFPPVYAASLQAGERSGSLEQVIRRYVAYVKIVATLKRKTLSALIYPVILLVLSLTVVTIIVVQVVPTFADFYGTFDRELPLTTRVIIGVSNLVLRIWPLLAIGVVAFVSGGWAWIQRPGNRVKLDRRLLGLPLVGATMGKFATSQFSRTLATLVGGGIPLVQALGTTADAVGNRAMAADIDQIARRVREGESMAGAMEETGSFPDVAVKMVEVGEATGALQEMLTSLADFFDEDIETSVGRFVAMFEPALLVVMGIVIASLLLALYLPVFQLSSVVSR